VTWRLVLEHQAEAEIALAAEWYGQRDVEIRDAFMAATAASLTAIEMNPLQYQQVRGEIRRAMIGRFPYALLYSVVGDDVVVTVCFHCRRDPRHWQDRVSE
jgi:plasmid stabilization system protein ParE